MIRSIRIRGFQSHRDTFMELSPGMNVLVGDTHTGKSAVLRALEWLAFNRPAGEAFIDPDSEVCEIEVITDRGKAVRTRKPENSYVLNDNVLTAIGRQVPDTLRRILHLGEVNLQSQDDMYYLVKDSPGAVGRTVTQALGLEVFDRAKSIASSKIKQLSDEEADLVAKIAQSEGGLQDYEGLDNYLQESLQIETDLQQLQELERQCNSLDFFLSSLQTARTEVDNLTEKLRGVPSLDSQDTVDSLNTKSIQISILTQLLDSLAFTDGEVQGLTKQHGEKSEGLESLKKDYAAQLENAQVCPYCFSAIHEGSAERITSQL